MSCHSAFAGLQPDITPDTSGFSVLILLITYESRRIVGSEGGRPPPAGLSDATRLGAYLGGHALRQSCSSAAKTVASCSGWKH